MKNMINNYCPTQDFEQIKKTYSINNRFVDDQFMTTNESVFYSSKFENYLRRNSKLPQNFKIVKWKRAKDFFLNAHFVLDQENRFKNLDEQLTEFPYINGKLFEENLPTASFDAKMRQALLDCCYIDWSKISPAIFGFFALNAK